MKVLVVGGGGREHAIIRKLKESARIGKLYCAPGNAGISADAQCVDIAASDIDGITRFAVENNIDFAVVAPDDPLVLGMVDSLENSGIRCFGPDKKAAQIEGSKVFSKDLMLRYGIPTARYESFNDPAQALNYIRSLGEWPVVIKADGLALGKGVIIPQNIAEAEDAIRRIMEDKIFGASGNAVVVEQFLTGPEVSVLAFCDGETIRPMVSSMDHKRVYDDNKGPNTGGMGTIAPNPHYTPEISRRCMDEIILPTVRAMKQEGRPFKGCLYFGLMLTESGPVVIEYNCRFGDPETQVVLPLLRTDLLTVMEAVRDGRLHEIDISWQEGAAACIMLASGGYPDGYKVGLPISGLDQNGRIAGAEIFHSGTKRDDTGNFVTAGGRVLGVAATGESLAQALSAAYAAAGHISFEGMHYRRDIGRY